MFTYKKASYKFFALGLKFCWASPVYTIYQRKNRKWKHQLGDFCITQAKCTGEFCKDRNYRRWNEHICQNELLNKIVQINVGL